MRVESGRPCKSGGWIHDAGDDFTPPVSQPLPQTSINAGALMHGWRRDTTADQITKLGVSLHILPAALDHIGVAWAPEYRAYAFPMHDGQCKVIGVRLRDMSGKKWAVTGSKQGMFVPSDADGAHPSLFVCEGPTDTAASLGIGLFAIGRPSCLGCEDYVSMLICRYKVRECVLAFDNDGPGVLGAEKLAKTLKVPFRRFTPPAKDMRAFVAAGGTLAVVQAILANCRAQYP